MAELLKSINTTINGVVWGPVMLLFLLGCGIYLTVRTGFFQLRLFKHMLKTTLGAIFKKQRVGKGALSPFQAMTTALAATVGIGNIVGVATAIYSGGPGAVFWMWVSAFFGMMTKYAEIVLAINFRERNKNGEWIGGPMYYIKKGLGAKWNFLAKLFCIFGVFASFGIGNIAQVNSISGSLNATLSALGIITDTSGYFSVNLVIGVIVAVLVGLVLLGGLKRIGSVTEKLVPAMAVFYLVGSIAVLAANYKQLLPSLSLIIKSAFSPKAAAGGVFGYTFLKAARFGFARGVFSNEAGLGSAPIAHASADTISPAKQGMFGIFEVFADTVVICTLTALAILCTGVFTGPGGPDGAKLTIAAFSTVLGSFGSVFISLSIILFAFPSLLGWSLYGQRCFEFLFKSNPNIYKVLFVITIVFGAIMDLTLAWELSDTLNGLMAIPNLIALFGLSESVFKITSEYTRYIKFKRKRL